MGCIVTSNSSFLLALVSGKPFFEPTLKTMLLIEHVAQLIDHAPAVVNLVIPGITKITCNIKLFGEGLTDIPADVIPSGGPHMVQPCFEPIGASAELACAGSDKQVFQISGTLVAFVLVMPPATTLVDLSQSRAGHLFESSRG